MITNNYIGASHIIEFKPNEFGMINHLNTPIRTNSIYIDNTSGAF